MTASGEERFIARYLAPLSEGFPGAFGLTDDCAEIASLQGHAFVVKTDPIVEGVHFFAKDAPEDLAWKALAVNVSDLAAKGARPVAYLMALTLPQQPQPEWMKRFAEGLRNAQEALGCVLIGGDTDCRSGPMSIAISVIGEVPIGRMVRRGGAVAGDLVYVSGELGGAALGLKLRLDGECTAALGGHLDLGDEAKQRALQRYLRPDPKIGLRAALLNRARTAMDISDGLFKDLDRMCRLTGVGADLEFAALPTAPGVADVIEVDRQLGVQLVGAGDDYEVLATVPPEEADQFQRAAALGGVAVSRIGHVVAKAGIRLFDDSGRQIDTGPTGYDHFDIK